MFLPSYSPDFSPPIKEAFYTFSKIKASTLRKAEARRREGLLKTVAEALEAATLGKTSRTGPSLL